MIIVKFFSISLKKTKTRLLNLTKEAKKEPDCFIVGKFLSKKETLQFVYASGCIRSRDNLLH